MGVEQKTQKQDTPNNDEQGQTKRKKQQWTTKRGRQTNTQHIDKGQNNKTKTGDRQTYKKRLAQSKTKRGAYMPTFKNMTIKDKQTKTKYINKGHT